MLSLCLHFKPGNLTVVLMCNSVNIGETEHLVNDDWPFSRLHF